MSKQKVLLTIFEMNRELCKGVTYNQLEELEELIQRRITQ